MKNSQVTQDFINGNAQTKTKHLFIEKNVLYSYGYHFPICLKLNDNVFIINSDGYSNTTARHKGYLMRAINDIRHKTAFVNTEKLKSLISQDIQNLSDAVIQEI